MILVGLTGGIGSGKSTISSLLEGKGAIIIDADAIVREVQLPGSAVLTELAAKFGAGVLAADGSLDRQAVANIVFTDPEKARVRSAAIRISTMVSVNCSRSMASGPLPRRSVSSFRPWVFSRSVAAAAARPASAEDQCLSTSSADCGAPPWARLTIHKASAESM